MEGNNGMKTSHLINLPTLNVKSQLNMNIDANTHIKQVLNIDTCLIETQIEPMFNKAIIKGKLGIKALYVDMDNMYNTLADTITFSETITSENISADCEIVLNNSQFFTEFDHDDNSLRISIEGNLDCFCNMNAGLNIFNQVSENLMVKKSVLETCNCVQKINKTVNYDFNFRIDKHISKILNCNSQIVLEENKCFDGYIVINGQILNTIIYETEIGGINSAQILTNSTPFKCEVESGSCDGDCVADLSAYIDLNDTQINTEINDSDTNITFEYCIVCCGYVYKNINLDVVEDLYSLDSDVETIKSTHNICKKLPTFKTIENIDSEITLADELNVDELLGMVNTSATITQSSIKDTGITLEGVINGNLLYLDENKEIHTLSTQIPYSIMLKQEITGNICASHFSLTPLNCKCKIKRGNMLMIDYEVCIVGTLYQQSSIELIENVKYGKPINYGDIAFQIFLAHPNETKWDLCKRLKTTPESLAQYNKEIPAVYQGGEKIIVYR